MSSEASPDPVENAAKSPKLSTEAAMSAATQEVVADYGIEAPDVDEIDFSAQEMPEFDIDDNTEEEAEAAPEGADPEEEDSEEAADEDAETDSESEDQDVEAEAEAVGVDWDGSPETVPPELKPGYDRMVEIGRKGVGKLVRQLQEQKAALEKQQQELTLALANVKQPQAQKADGPPELPTESVSDAEWNAAVDKRNQWFINKAIQDKVANGEILTADQYQSVQQTLTAQHRVGLVQQQEGWTPEVGMRMADLVEQTPTLSTMMDSDQGAVDLFKLALKDLNAERLIAENKTLSGKAAQKAAEDAKRKAGAASRAVSRPGAAKSKATPADTYRKTAFRNTEERLDFLASEVRRDFKI